MNRIPHAARVLRDQLIDRLNRVVSSEAGRGTMTPVKESADGLSVYREFDFDPIASRTLLKLLPSLDDRRIVGYTTRGDGEEQTVRVTFASGVVADYKDPFPLGAVDDEDESPAVLDLPSASAPLVTEEPPAKKTASKRTARKTPGSRN